MPQGRYSTEDLDRRKTGAFSLADIEGPEEAASKAVSSSAPARFAGSMVEQINPIPLIEAILRQPKEVARAILGPFFDNPYKAGADIVSAPVMRAIEQGGAGDLAGAAGTIAGVGASMLATGKPSARVGIKPRLNPVEAGAVAFAGREGVPLSAGVKTGSQTIKGLEAGMKHMPGPAGVAEKAGAATEEAMSRVTSGMGARIEPTAAGTAVEAGESVLGNASRRINNYDTAADVAYTKLRKIAESKKTTVTTGSKNVKVGPYGKSTGSVPVTHDLAGAVDVRAVKDWATKTAAEIEGTMLSNLGDKERATMQAALKQSSPGYATLRQIADAPDFMSVADADRNLSAIKELARNKMEHSSVRAALRNKSQGLMAKTVPQLHFEIDRAVAALGPEAQKALLAGRTATKKKYELSSLIDQFSKEPVRAFEKLVMGKDRSIKLLNEIKTNAPETIPDVARATLEGIIAKASDQRGIFRGQRALADWNKLGKQTKELLFGGKLQDIEDMFQLGSMIKLDANPSGSARVGAGLAAINSLIEAPIKTSAKLLGAKRLAQAFYSGDTQFVINAPKAFGYASAAPQVIDPQKKLLSGLEQ